MDILGEGLEPCRPSRHSPTAWTAVRSVPGHVGAYVCGGVHARRLCLNTNLCERLATPRHCAAVAPKFGRSAVQHFLCPSHLATISSNLVYMHVCAAFAGWLWDLFALRGCFTDCPMGTVRAGGDAEPCWDREPCHECHVRRLRTHVSGSCPNSKGGSSNPNVQRHR